MTTPKTSSFVRSTAPFRVPRHCPNCGALTHSVPDGHADRLLLDHAEGGGYAITRTGNLADLIETAHFVGPGKGDWKLHKCWTPDDIQRTEPETEPLPAQRATARSSPPSLRRFLK